VVSGAGAWDGAGGHVCEGGGLARGTVVVGARGGVPRGWRDRSRNNRLHIEIGKKTCNGK
jgi:hypothetical protein